MPGCDGAGTEWLTVGLPWISTMIVILVHMSVYAKAEDPKPGRMAPVEKLLYAWFALGCALCVTFTVWSEDHPGASHWLLVAVIMSIAVGGSWIAAPFEDTKRQDAQKVKVILALVNTAMIVPCALFFLVADPLGGDDRCARAAAWHVMRDGWSRAMDAVSANTEPLCVFLVLSPFVFWSKYHDSFRRQRGKTRVQDGGSAAINESDFPLPSKDRKRSEAIVSMLVVVISVFVFLRTMDSVGMSVAAYTLFVTYSHQGAGWALRDLLGSVFTGFSLAFNSDMAPGQLLVIDGNESVIETMGITHVKCRPVRSAPVVDTSKTSEDQSEDRRVGGVVYGDTKLYYPNKVFGEAMYRTYDPMHKRD
jgi:MFS family permease